METTTLLVIFLIAAALLVGVLAGKKRQPTQPHGVTNDAQYIASMLAAAGPNSDPPPGSWINGDSATFIPLPQGGFHHRRQAYHGNGQAGNVVVLQPPPVPVPAPAGPTVIYPPPAPAALQPIIYMGGQPLPTTPPAQPAAQPAAQAGGNRPPQNQGGANRPPQNQGGGNPPPQGQGGGNAVPNPPGP